MAEEDQGGQEEEEATEVAGTGVREDTDSGDDDDDNEQDDEVVADTEWDDLASEDTLTGIYSFVQGPFLVPCRGKYVRGVSGDGPNR